MKREKQDAIHIPAALEIVRCNEGGKEYIKERKHKRDHKAWYTLIAEFPIHSQTDEEINIMKRLAKRFARDYVRTARAMVAVVMWNGCGAGKRACLQVLDKDNGGWMP